MIVCMRNKKHSYKFFFFVLFLAINSTISNSPIHTIRSINTYQQEEDELEKDIEHLERRLAFAKSQLLFSNYQKNKPAFKS